MRIGVIVLLLGLMVQTGHAEPIWLHPDNPHYLEYNGKPVVLITSAEHYGAVLNLDFDYTTYLNTLQQDGMNYTRIFTGAYVERTGSFGIENNTLAPASGRFLAPWKQSDVPGFPLGGNKFDLDQWNEEYFIRLVDFVREAEKRDIIVEVTFFSSIYSYWDVQPFHPDNNVNATAVTKETVNTLYNGSVLGYQEALVRRIVNELNAFDNIIYELQNEPWSDHAVTVDTIMDFYSPDDLKQPGNFWKNRIDLADDASLAWQNKIASFVVDEEKRLENKHLIAQNFCNFRWPIDKVNPNIAIMNYHYAYPDVVRQNRWHDRVIGFDESGFCGQDDEPYRKQAWHFILSGGGLFNNLDYSFTVEHEDGTAENNAPGGGGASLRKQLSILSDFIHSFDVVNMQPDCESIIAAPDCIASALVNPGIEYAIYLDGHGPALVQIRCPAGDYAVEMMDPLTGVVLRSESVEHDGDIMAVQTPVFNSELAISIRAQTDIEQ